MNESYIRDALGQRLLPDHILLVFEIDEYRRDSSFFKLCYIRQLPPYRTASPTYGLYQAVSSFHFLIGEWYGIKIVFPLHFPFDIGIFVFEPFL